MPRQLISLALVLVAGAAHAARAQPAPAVAPADMSDQALGGQIGAALGSHVTAGGVRVAGHYLYQLSDRDWFDGAAVFTFGGTSAQCFFDRSNKYVCEHGITDGDAAMVDLSVRRFFPGNGAFWPFARAGLGAGIVEFPRDNVSGLAIPLHVGGGVRASVSQAIAIVAEGQLSAGIAFFGHGVGTQPQLGFAVTAGVEFGL